MQCFHAPLKVSANSGGGIFFVSVSKPNLKRFLQDKNEAAAAAVVACFQEVRTECLTYKNKHTYLHSALEWRCNAMRTQFFIILYPSVLETGDNLGTASIYPMHACALGRHRRRWVEKATCGDLRIRSEM